MTFDKFDVNQKTDNPSILKKRLLDELMGLVWRRTQEIERGRSYEHTRHNRRLYLDMNAKEIEFLGSQIAEVQEAIEEIDGGVIVPAGYDPAFDLNMTPVVNDYPPDEDAIRERAEGLARERREDRFQEAQGGG